MKRGNVWSGITLVGMNKVKKVAITERLPTMKTVGDVTMGYARKVSRPWHPIGCPLFLQQCREDGRVWRGG